MFTEWDIVGKVARRTGDEERLGRRERSGKSAIPRGQGKGINSKGGGRGRRGENEGLGLVSKCMRMFGLFDVYFKTCPGQCVKNLSILDRRLMTLKSFVL